MTPGTLVRVTASVPALAGLVGVVMRRPSGGRWDPSRVPVAFDPQDLAARGVRANMRFRLDPCSVEVA